MEAIMNFLKEEDIPKILLVFGLTLMAASLIETRWYKMSKPAKILSFILSLIFIGGGVYGGWLQKNPSPETEVPGGPPQVTTPTVKPVKPGSNDGSGLGTTEGSTQETTKTYNRELIFGKQYFLAQQVKNKYIDVTPALYSEYGIKDTIVMEDGAFFFYVYFSNAPKNTIFKIQFTSDFSKYLDIGSLDGWGKDIDNKTFKSHLPLKSFKIKLK